MVDTCNSKLFQLHVITMEIDVLSILIDFISGFIFNVSNYKKFVPEEGKVYQTNTFVMLALFATTDAPFKTHMLPVGLIFSVLFESLIDIQKFIKSFTVSLELPPLILHPRVIIVQLIYALVFLKIMMSSIQNFINTKSVFSLTMFEQALEMTFMNIDYAICHLIFLNDRQNFGSSIKSEHLSQIVGFIFGISIAFSFLIYVLIRLAMDFKSLMNYFVLVNALYRLYIECLGYSQWKNIMTHIRSDLPDPTEEDIQHDDICIICRQQMTQDTAKKLPCSHCCHTYCLERWIVKNPQCPLCKSDLSFLQNNQVQQIEKVDE